MREIGQARLRVVPVLRVWGPAPQGEVCRCPEGDDCWYFPNYVWCRACEEHHRQECVVNELGQGLDPDGNPWPEQA